MAPSAVAAASSYRNGDSDLLVLFLMARCSRCTELTEGFTRKILSPAGGRRHTTSMPSQAAAPSCPSFLPVFLPSIADPASTPPSPRVVAS
ncbi:hypothetical protein AcV7_008272 [Taiwanofungus camphoratus]|nr:hypothetical protein AcV7_008272 [Antrodia cinnamomea]